jgi:hypothetical protein
MYDLTSGRSDMISKETPIYLLTWSRESPLTQSWFEQGENGFVIIENKQRGEFWS